MRKKFLRMRNGELGGFLGVMFFLFLADAILSDWAPGFVQNIVGRPVLMGLIISFSSVVGLIMDFVFAEILGGSKVKKLIWWSISGLMVFVGMWGVVIVYPWVWLMLLAMGAWGFYYDLFGFVTQQYVTENATSSTRASMWSVVGVIKNLAYFLGPVIGTSLVALGHKEVVVVSAGVLAVAGILLSLVRLTQKEEEFKHHKISFKAEIDHWKVLSKKVWPILIVSLVLGLVDATYWTAGTIVSDQLASQSWWGGMFLSLYVLPSLLVGLIMSRVVIKKGKKKLALVFMMLSGLVLAGIQIMGEVSWILGVVFVSSSCLAITWPLTNAVYTDLLERMGREREHLLGLSDSMMNIAYIVGPILSGLIAGLVGELNTFVVVGWLMVVVGVGLWLVMPRKLRLPQREMLQW